MSPWLYLLLAHLLADFALQTAELVRLKRRPAGLLLHMLIPAVVTAAIAAPILPRWWLIIPAMSVAHYVVDGLKVRYAPARGPGSFAAFVGDQLVHFGILTAVVWGAGLSLTAPVAYGSPTLMVVLYYGVPYVAAVFAGAILVYQVALAWETRADPVELLQSLPRLLGMVERTVALTVVLFFPTFWWWIAAVVPGIKVGANQRQARRWIETTVGLLFTVGLGLLFR